MRLLRRHALPRASPERRFPAFRAGAGEYGTIGGRLTFLDY